MVLITLLTNSTFSFFKLFKNAHRRESPIFFFKYYCWQDKWREKVFFYANASKRQKSVHINVKLATLSNQEYKTEISKEKLFSFPQLLFCRVWNLKYRKGISNLSFKEIRFLQPRK